MKTTSRHYFTLCIDTLNFFYNFMHFLENFMSYKSLYLYCMFKCAKKSNGVGKKVIHIGVGLNDNLF